MSWSKEKKKREGVNTLLCLTMAGGLIFGGFNLSTYQSATGETNETTPAPDTQPRLGVLDALADGSFALIGTDLLLVGACATGLYANNRGRDSQATDTTYNPVSDTSS